MFKGAAQAVQETAEYREQVADLGNLMVWRETETTRQFNLCFSFGEAT